MTETTTTTTESVETIEAEAFMTLAPTGKRIDFSSYDGPEVLLVTRNEAGKFRAALGDNDLAVGDQIVAKHAKRKFSYGTLTVVARKVGDKVEGEAPEGSLPLRLIG